MTKTDRFSLPPIPSVILAIISVQGGAAIAKTLFPLAGAAATAMLRIGFSAVILLVVFRPNLFRVTRTQWRLVIPYGIVLGAMNMIFYLAIERIPLGLGVALEFVGPLLLAVFSSRRIPDFIWVILAATGILLLSPWTGSDHNLTGIVLALVAGGLWAAYIVLSGRISKIMRSGDAVTIGMLFATLTTIPFAVSSDWSAISATVFLQGAALAFLSSVIPFTLEMNALRTLSSRVFSILMSLEPAVAALCGLVFLREQLSLLEWSAIVLIMIASTGVAITGRSQHHDAGT